MAKRYDFIVVGTGTAAKVAATRVRAEGWQVAVIDFRPVGGTCALRGCNPKKMLHGGACAVDHARRMHGKGIVGDSHIDWPALVAYKRTVTDLVPQNDTQQLQDKGIDVIQGRARFVGPNTLEVDGSEQYDGRYILLASGAEPKPLGIPGHEYLIDNEAFMSLPLMPQRVALVGGGYIAAEFSTIAALAGARVSIFQQADRILEKFDPDLVNWLMEAFYAYGIEVRTDTLVEAIEKTLDGFRVYASTKGAKLSIDTDLVVHAGGRAPSFDAFNLEAAGVEVENGKLKLNKFLQSVSNPAVYAAGDAAQSGPPLTPVAHHDATIVAENILKGNHLRPDYRGVPSVAFTVPPIAAVGLSEADAHKKGCKFRKQSQKAPTWFTARQDAQPVYGFKVLVDEDTDQVLGAHLVGPHADEVINLFALAIRHGLPAASLKATMFGYPTGASDIEYML